MAFHDRSEPAAHTRVAVGVLALAALAATALAAIAAGAEPLPHSLKIWDNAARLALPPWLAVWLGVLVLTFAASLAFVRRHRAARWVLVGFLVSHALVVLVELSEVAVLRTGLVSTAHVIGWLPAWFAVLHDLSGARGSRYGIWCHAILAVLSIALIFDLRDAGMYLYYQLAGHPALVAG